jgi:penicillin-binding protein 1B
MAKRGAKRQASRAKRRGPALAWVRRHLSLISALVLAATLAVLGYLIYLDRLVTETFEGRRWSVPAVVYAAPLEIYPGARLSQIDVITELERLGYEQRKQGQAAGTYWPVKQALSVRLRAFRFMERARESQHINIDFRGRQITGIRDTLGRPIPLIRLDPIIIGSFFPSHGEDRLVLTPHQVPDLLTNGLKAVEDQRFDSHAGFDLSGIARAMWVNLKSAELKQGGSTLTQQLVKSYFLDNRRTISRKLRELAMAIILEIRFTKTDLLNAYVNEIYLGQDGVRAVHGFGLGAQFYFNRPLQELSTAELATLIAIIRGPSYYNPFRHPMRALERRNRVLEIMLEQEIIDAPTYATATQSDLGVIQGARRGGAYYPAFMDLVRQNLAELSGDDLTSNGLRVFATLNPRTQDVVEAELAGTLQRLEAQRGLPADKLQAAVVITHTQTGEVQALAGARRGSDDGFNRALQARRPIGSLVKPVVYLTAIEQGYHLASIVEDAPVSIDLPNQPSWQPQNFDKNTHGPVPLVRALGDSLNLATVNLGVSLGVDSVASRLDTLTGRNTSNRYPSLLLGAESLTPIEVAGLYGTFASGGFRMPAKAVVAVLDEQSTTIARHPFAMEQQIDPLIAETLNMALRIVMRNGTGKSSRFRNAGVAGKTGTSDDYRDSWFAGFDNNQLAVVWVGNDDYSSMGLTGATGALAVWDSIMAQLTVEPLPEPTAELTSVEYATGHLANAACAEVVEIPLPAGSTLQHKPGCGITLRSVSDRIRKWLQ